LSAGLAREALDRGLDVFAGYGMSETGPILTITRLQHPAETPSGEAEVERRRRAGLPIPLVDLRLIDEEQRELPHDGRSVGEVAVRAPWATVSYTRDREASERLWRGGYLHTQDVGSIDAHGCLQITDRLKDVIKSGGEWLSSLEIENLISRLEGVAEVAVVAVQDERWGERPHAFVVPRLDWREQLTPDVVRDHVAAAAAAGEVPSYAVPERITLITELPRTSVGKINKRALRDIQG
jgi:fatty-acyl-CoA synthase